MYQQQSYGQQGYGAQQTGYGAQQGYGTQQYQGQDPTAQQVFPLPVASDQPDLAQPPYSCSVTTPLVACCDLEA